MLVTVAAARDFRCYERLELELGAGLTAVVGDNGAGKTSLLEAVHVATQGFSLRTRRDARAVRVDATAARVVARGTRGPDLPFATEVVIERGGGKRVTFDGAEVAGTDALRARLPVLAFTPDRLAVVKGGPVVRRAYLDRVIGRLSPLRASLPGEYGRALAQRNAALRRARDGDASALAIAPWTEAVARLGTELDRARVEAVALLAPAFADRAARLGLLESRLAYEPSGVSVDALDMRLRRDVERGATGAGPHLVDLSLSAGGRELRMLGSQGEQRIAVLALLLAEGAALAAARDETPLLLLDDVLSELDDGRRHALLTSVPATSQALVTATSLRSLPAGGPEPARVVEVVAGTARPR